MLTSTPARTLRLEGTLGTARGESSPRRSRRGPRPRRRPRPWPTCGPRRPAPAPAAARATRAGVPSRAVGSWNRRLTIRLLGIFTWHPAAGPRPAPDGGTRAASSPTGPPRFPLKCVPRSARTRTAPKFRRRVCRHAPAPRCARRDRRILKAPRSSAAARPRATARRRAVRSSNPSWLRRAALARRGSAALRGRARAHAPGALSWGRL